MDRVDVVHAAAGTVVVLERRLGWGARDAPGDRVFDQSGAGRRLP